MRQRNASIPLVQWRAKMQTQKAEITESAALPSCKAARRSQLSKLIRAGNTKCINVRAYSFLQPPPPLQLWTTSTPPLPPPPPRFCLLLPPFPPTSSPSFSSFATTTSPAGPPPPPQLNAPLLPYLLLPSSLSPRDHPGGSTCREEVETSGEVVQFP